jgi:hypothetical protein
MSGVRAAARAVLAAVWLYEGLWCKIRPYRRDSTRHCAGASPGDSAAFAARLHAALRHAVRPGAPIVLRSIHDRSPLPGRPLPDRSLLWGAVTLVETGG